MGGVWSSNHDPDLDRRDAWVGSKILTETITERASVGMALLLERNGALLGVHAEVWTKVFGSCGKKVLDNAAIVRDAAWRTRMRLGPQAPKTPVRQIVRKSTGIS